MYEQFFHSRSYILNFNLRTQYSQSKSDNNFITRPGQPQRGDQAGSAHAAEGACQPHPSKRGGGGGKRPKVLDDHNLA